MKRVPRKEMTSLRDLYAHFFDKFQHRVRKMPQSYVTAFFVLLPSILYVARAWQYIAHPQLYAEDGAVWMADAHNKGMGSIFLPYNQFLHTFERVFALLVIHFPLDWAPFLFNVTGFALFVLMCYYLFSARSSILTSNFQRLFIAFSLGLIANFTQFYFNFSNSIFLVGVIGLCIYLVQPSRHFIVRLLEKVFFILACLTLPFACFYLPIILFDYFRHKTKKVFYLVCSVIGSVTQLMIYASTATHRPTIPITMLLSSKYVFIELLNQIITPALFFVRFYNGFNAQSREGLPIAIFCILLILLSLFVVIKHAGTKLRYFIFFLIVFTMVALKAPLVGSNIVGINVLRFMAVTPGGNRYFFYGILSLLLIIALAAETYIKKRASYVFLAGFMLFGLTLSIASDSWTIHKFFFVSYSQAYSEGVEKLRKNPRTPVAIPENPVGWTIELNAK